MDARSDILLWVLGGSVVVEGGGGERGRMKGVVNGCWDDEIGGSGGDWCY